MTNNQFVKIVIPYFTERPIELIIRKTSIPTDLEMIKFKALNCLVAEKGRSETIADLRKFINGIGIELIENTDHILENQYEIFKVF